MAEELDYRLEAESQATFAAAFDGDPDFAVPHVVEGREHVIVSEWLEGLPLSRIIAEGTQEQRDTASQLYLRFLLAGPARAGLLHADPHPGNFRITPDGRLGVIDFGAVNRLPDGMPPEIGPLLTTGLEGSAEDVLAGLREIGFVKERIDLDPQRLLDYLEPFMAPFRTDTFTFSRDWLRGSSPTSTTRGSPTTPSRTSSTCRPSTSSSTASGVGASACSASSAAPSTDGPSSTSCLPGADLPPVADAG